MAAGRSRFSIFGEFRLLDRLTGPLQRMERRIGGFMGRVDRAVGHVHYAARSIGQAFMAAGDLIASGARIAARALEDVIETGLEFDQTMSMAGSRFGVERGSEDFARVEEAARRAGATTQFSAQQAAEALAELGASGTSAEDAVAQLPILLNTAAAAEMELGEASDILTDQMSAFGLATGDSAQQAQNLARVSDVMARGANTTSMNFEQLTGALGNVAAGANSAGLDIEATTALIGALAEQGEKGERAGTRLNAMLTNLRNPTAAARAELRRLHINVRDANHQLRPMPEIMAEFERAMGGMNAEARDRSLGRVFSEQGLRPMQLLLQTGSARLQAFETDLRGAGGSAADVARQMRDSAAGDLQTFESTVESIKLELWGLVRGPFRAVVQATTEWIRANQGWISSGLQEGIAWLEAHLPEIEYWGIRIGLAFLILLSPIILAMAIMVIASVVIIGLIVGIVLAIVVVVDWLYNLGVAIWESVSAAFDAAWNAVAGFVTAAQEFLVGLWVIVSGAAMRYLRPVFDFLGRAAGVVRAFWAPIGAFFSSIWSGIAKAFGSAWDWIMGEATSLYDEFLAIWNPLANFFQGLWDTIASAFWNTIGGVVDTIGSVVGSIREEGRAEMERREGGGERRERQMVSPEERTARAISETTTTERAEVTIRDETGRAEVTRPPRRARGRISLQASGA